MLSREGCTLVIVLRRRDTKESTWKMLPGGDNGTLVVLELTRMVVKWRHSLKWPHHVCHAASQGSQELLGVFLNIKCDMKKNPLFMWGGDRKSRPSRSPRDWQASSCQTVTIGSLVIPNGDPRDLFFYPTLTLMINILRAHRVRISEILPWDTKSYLTHIILPRLSREGYIQLTHAHCEVTSLLC